jgi:hypothetical protein
MRYGPIARGQPVMAAIAATLCRDLLLLIVLMLLLLQFQIDSDYEGGKSRNEVRCEIRVHSREYKKRKCRQANAREETKPKLLTPPQAPLLQLTSPSSGKVQVAEMRRLHFHWSG